MPRVDKHELHIYTPELNIQQSHREESTLKLRIIQLQSFGNERD